MVRDRVVSSPSIEALEAYSRNAKSRAQLLFDRGCPASQIRGMFHRDHWPEAVLQDHYRLLMDAPDPMSSLFLEGFAVWRTGPGEKNTGIVTAGATAFNSTVDNTGPATLNVDGLGQIYEECLVTWQPDELVKNIVVAHELLGGMPVEPASQTDAKPPVQAAQPAKPASESLGRAIAQPGKQRVGIFVL